LIATAYKLPESLWSVEFSKCLTGSALLAYEVLSKESNLKFPEVVKAMRRRFGINVHTMRKRFLNAKCQENESQNDCVIRLRKYYLEWLEKAGYEQKYEDLLEHIVLDRYYQSQSNELRVFIKEKGRLTLEEMTAQAENYIEAHKMF
jgi:SCAN domain